MLYVDMEINGQPVKAFIDSGAQMTIMTKAMAESVSRCTQGGMPRTAERG